MKLPTAVSFTGAGTIAIAGEESSVLGLLRRSTGVCATVESVVVSVRS